MARTLYIANQRLPTEKAYGIQITKMCEAFADYGLSPDEYKKNSWGSKQQDHRKPEGTEVELIYPYRRNYSIKSDIFAYYSVKRIFKARKIFSPDFYLPGRLDWLAFHVKNLISALALCFYAVIKKPDIVYSRDEIIIFLLSFIRTKNTFFEIHRFSKSRSFFYRRFKNIGVRVISISEGIKDELVKIGFPPGRILVAQDGVDIDEFNVNIDQNEIRIKLRLPLDKKLLGYIGSFKTMGMEKGLGVMFEAVLKLKDDDLRLVLVGGSDKDADSYSKLAESLGIKDKIIFVGRIKHSEVPNYLRAFDILLAPFPDLKHYRLYMSPLKIFEYMASGRPIVASDLPAIREVLSGDNAVLVKPDRAGSPAGGIGRAINDPGLAEDISQAALRDIKNYTWQKRAVSIKNFMKTDMDQMVIKN